ncbi:class I SAM-dependent methyltransferase [Solidesulfovibrio sp.]
MSASRIPTCPCGREYLVAVFRYDAPPAGESRFAFSGDRYRRDILRCPACGHFVSRHAMDMGGLYASAYVDATYGDAMRAAFERIAALPPDRSDNEGRARCLIDVARRQFPDAPPTVLDVGSGLCVFLHRMKREGWICTALDPDPRAAAHARDVVGVAALCGDFQTTPGLGLFQVITFNKVLEHVCDPVAVLARARRHLQPGGLVYVELPDGEAAWPEGPGREEFFIEHHHVMSLASTAILVAKAGFMARRIERLREPSGKYTLRAFLHPIPEGATGRER